MNMMAGKVIICVMMSIASNAKESPLSLFSLCLQSDRQSDGPGVAIETPNPNKTIEEVIYKFVYLWIHNATFTKDV